MNRSETKLPFEVLSLFVVIVVLFVGYCLTPYHLSNDTFADLPLEDGALKEKGKRKTSIAN